MMPASVKYADASPDTWQRLIDNLTRVIAKSQKTRKNADHSSRASFCSRVAHNDSSAYRWTGLDMRTLSLIWASFAAKYPCVPRAKTEYVLEPVHVLLLALVQKYQNYKAEMLGDMFCMDTLTVSEYLALADAILVDVLPTPEKITKVAKCIRTPQDFVSLFPKGADNTVVIFDGIRVRLASPKMAQKRDTLYLCNKNRTSGNTVVMASNNGLILGISQTYSRRTHYIKIIRDLFSDMGHLGRMLQDNVHRDASEEMGKKYPETQQITRDVSAAGAYGSPDSVIRTQAAYHASKKTGVIQDLSSPNSTASHVIQVLADRGFSKLHKGVPEADAHNPFPSKGKLTPGQAEYNHALYEMRASIEHAIARTTHFKSVCGVYTGSPDAFNKEFNIACGLANIRHMLCSGTYNDWARTLDLYTID